MSRIQGLCPSCGNYFRLEAPAGAVSISCGFCAKPIRVLPHSALDLPAVEAKGDTSVVTGSAVLSGGYIAVPDQVPAEGAAESPAGSSVTGRLRSRPSSAQFPAGLRGDPDSEAVGAAWRIFGQKGWSCQRWPGLLAFAASGEALGAGGVVEPLSLTVSASAGILSLETVVCALPKPPLTDLRELLCRINVRTGGSVFLARECGVVARVKIFSSLLLEPVEAESLLERLLRQLNLDRLAAQSLLKDDGFRIHLGNPLGIQKAFANPIADGATSRASFMRLQHLAEASRYPVKVKGAMLYLGAAGGAGRGFPVWFSFSAGLLRGWTVPGTEPGRREGAGPLGLLGGAGSGPSLVLPRGQRDALFRRLDELNESSGLFHYVWNGQQVLAMVLFPPAEARLEAELFHYVTDSLLQRAGQPIHELDGVFQA